MFNNGTVTVQQQPESIFTPSKRYYLMGFATIMVVLYHFHLKQMWELSSIILLIMPKA